MKTKIYLRISSTTGKRRPAVRASMKPDYSPIEGTVSYKQKKFFPTVAFAVEVDIPDNAFKRAEKVLATLILKEDDVKINEIKATL